MKTNTFCHFLFALETKRAHLLQCNNSAVVVAVLIDRVILYALEIIATKELMKLVYFLKVQK